MADRTYSAGRFGFRGTEITNHWTQPSGVTQLMHVGSYDGTGDFSSDQWRLVGMAAVGAGAYHGYKRTGSAGWAIAYGILTGLFPLIGGGIILAQGFGKRK